jgi:hypothetical protein
MSLWVIPLAMAAFMCDCWDWTPCESYVLYVGACDRGHLQTDLVQPVTRLSSIVFESLWQASLVSLASSLGIRSPCSRSSRHTSVIVTGYSLSATEGENLPNILFDSSSYAHPYLHTSPLRTATTALPWNGRHRNLRACLPPRRWHRINVLSRQRWTTACRPPPLPDCERGISRGSEMTLLHEVNSRT